jgi:hypothetical protein
VNGSEHAIVATPSTVSGSNCAPAGKIARARAAPPRSRSTPLPPQSGPKTIALVASPTAFQGHGIGAPFEDPPVSSFPQLYDIQKDLSNNLRFDPLSSNSTFELPNSRITA